ncbi:MAG: 50S ribosomal protein L6 [Planctomycetota bacterium]
MSRIGKKPIEIPAGVNVRAGAERVEIEGPLGRLQMIAHPGISVRIDDAKKQAVVERSGDSKKLRALHGLARALIRNMVIGVTAGFERKLEIVGVGYGAKIQGHELVLNLGFATPVVLPIPESVKIEVPQPTRIRVSGNDKQQVGEFAAEIRRSKPPEPYKGKGIKYEGEFIRRKAGKSFVGAGG